MYLSRVRGALEEAGRRGRHVWGGSPSSNNSLTNIPSPTPTTSTQFSDEDFNQETTHTSMSDHAMLERARAAHNNEDFVSLAAGPKANGPWKRVVAVGRFVVSRKQVTADSKGRGSNGLEVLCAGRLDASLEEVASILRSNSESEHNAAMTALYTKSFIFGSYEREIPCSESEQHDNQDEDIVTNSSEQLAVKTKSFARTTIMGRNEQWCYFDYFHRKKERDGFTILKRALSPSETTPGRIVGENARVNQLHGLNASYLVDKLPNRGGLRVVFHAWFELEQDQTWSENSRRRSQESTNSSSCSNSLDYGDSNKHKTQLRRLLTMAHGFAKLADLVRRRRFGVQVPANPSAISTRNTRCPCCTHSLAPVKLSFSMAASAIANRSLSHLKMDTRRCYLCGFLVCINCWSAEHMESVGGRVAAIVVCTRCHVNVQACEYAEVFAGTAAEREKHRGPARVVKDSNNASTVPLLVDFLSASLLNAAAGSQEHAAVMVVIRLLLQQLEAVHTNNDNDYTGNNDDYERAAPRFKELEATAAVEKVGELLSDEQHLPGLEACKLGNSDQRSYPLELPDDPTVDVPMSPIPNNEAERIASIKAAGLLRIANLFAPETPPTDSSEVKTDVPDVSDLELLCQLAVKTLGCAFSFVTIMCAKHEHVVVGTHPGFVGAAVPRDQTTCQHALMSPYPFVVAHHEADVRFHRQGTTIQVPIRFYVGFPLTVPLPDAKRGEEEMTVGMLCCIDSKPRAEITRTQYATMKRLASAATHFLLQKSEQLQQHSPVH